MLNCTLGDDRVPSYGDICNFTCNTGYELTDSDTRICQSDKNWSGSDDVCRRGTCLLICMLLANNCVNLKRECKTPNFNCCIASVLK